MQPTQTTCKNCGNLFEGNYCNACGEKSYTGKDKKLSHILEEVFHFTTHLDNKFLRTFKLIFFRPGLVSKEYCEGKRKKYFKPISLFLIGVIIYLLFPLLQGLNISFSNHIHNNNFLNIQYSKQWALNKMQKEKISEQQLAEKFETASPKIAKILLFLLLPLTAAAFALIFKNKNRYFFDNFILATEFNTAFIFLFFLIFPLIAVSLSAVLPFKLEYGDTLPYIIIQVLAVFTILIIAFRRFYSVSFLRALLSSLLFILAYAIIVFIYRQIVFTLVMLFI